MLQLLGHPGAIGRGTFPRKGLEVLAVAALSPGRKISRTALASLIWSDVEAPRANGNLRYVISALRQWETANGIAIIHASKTHVRSAGATDVDRLIALSEEPKAAANSLIQYGNRDLLAGYAGGSESFDEWLSQARGAIDKIVVETALRSAGAPSEVAMACELALHRSPYDERLLRHMIKNLVHDHRQAEAAAAIRNFAHRVTVELQATISTATLDFIAALMPVKAAVEIVGGDKPSQQRKPDRWALPKVMILPPPATETATDTAIARALVREVTLSLCEMRTFAMFAPHTASQLILNTAEEQAAALGAEYVVHTELVGRKRLIFTLIYLPTRAIMLADTINLERGHVAAVQMGRALGASLSARISAREVLEYRATGAASAYVHFLLGCEQLTYDLPSIRKARKNFLKALDLYPNFAPAKAMLARTLSREWLVLKRPDTDLLSSALRAADEALEIDPLGTVGHWEKGNVLLYLKQMDQGLAYIQEARSRAPHLADLLVDEADVYVHLGEGAQALEHLDLAMRLNPMPPDDYRWVQGSARFVSEDYAGAVSALREMIDPLPASRLMAASLAMAGDLERAARYRDVWLEQYPDFKVADWAKTVPVRSQDKVDQMVTAMRLAGFR